MELTTINRFPILIGFASPRANRSNQLRGNASIRPPNSVSSADESLRERHTISSWRRLRPGLRTITSWPEAFARRASSCASTQCISAVLRHRYTGKTTLHKVPVDECASRTRLEVFFKCDRCLFFCEGEVSNEKPRAKLGSMWGTTFVVRFKPLASIARRADVLFSPRRFRLEQVNVVHHRAGLPAVACRFWAVRLR